MSMPADDSVMQVVPADMLRTAIQTTGEGESVAIIMFSTSGPVGYAANAAEARQIASSLLDLADELDGERK